LSFAFAAAVLWIALAVVAVAFVVGMWVLFGSFMRGRSPEPLSTETRQPEARLSSLRRVLHQHWPGLPATPFPQGQRPGSDPLADPIGIVPITMGSLGVGPGDLLQELMASWGRVHHDRV